jgi:hypothetical protein
MKNWATETVRLAQAAVEIRDILRRLAAQIQAAGTDADHRAEALEAALVVATTRADLLRRAVKQSSARRGSGTPDARPLWAVGERV